MTSIPGSNNFACREIPFSFSAILKTPKAPLKSDKFADAITILNQLNQYQTQQRNITRN